MDLFSIATLAQLVAPPSQPGPARTPSIFIDRGSKKTNKIEIIDQEIIQDQSDQPTDRTNIDDNSIEHRNTTLPRIEGPLPYTDFELDEILEECRKSSFFNELLNECASALTVRLVTDGYVNTRVIVNEDEKPVTLIVLPGQLVEVRVFGSNESINQEILMELKEIKQRTLNILELQKLLNEIEARNDIESLSAQLSRHGSQTTQTALIVQVVPRHIRWDSYLSVDNNGSKAFGELDIQLATQRQNLIKINDLFLAYLQLNKTSDLDLRSVTQSFSYSYPISKNLSINATFGAGITRFPKSGGQALDITFNSFQGVAGINWDFFESSYMKSFLSGQIVGSRGNLYINERVPSSSLVSDIVKKPMNSYLKLVLGSYGTKKNLSWWAQLYGLQGIAGLTPENQLKERQLLGLDIGRARAVGFQGDLKMQITSEISFNINSSGQIALQPIPNTMNFLVGSDQGLIGLPSTTLSGNSGILAMVKLPIEIWSGSNGTLELVPLIGIGYVHSRSTNFTLNDEVGSYGGLLRYKIVEPSISIEFGITRPFFFADNESSGWDDALIGKGIYTKASYSF